MSKIVTPSEDLLSYVTEQINNGFILKENVVKILNKADFNITDIEIDKIKVDPDAAMRSLSAHSGDVFSADFKKLLLAGKVITINLGFKHLIRNAGVEKAVTLPYEQQSLGTQRFYQFAGVLDLLMRHPKVAVFDEIESSLHPELLKYFILLFLRNTRESQLIFTTHQRDFLQEGEMLRHDVVHFTEKGEDGSTDLYSMADFDSSVIRKGSSLYNAYKSGKLGATPELEDAYIPMD